MVIVSIILRECLSLFYKHDWLFSDPFFFFLKIEIEIALAKSDFKNQKEEKYLPFYAVQKGSDQVGFKCTYSPDEPAE